MALTSAGSCSSSSSHIPLLKKYDVFISFRGEDTRDNFTSHLHAALLRNKIETYIDYRINKGDEVWSTLVEAIQNSTLFLLILSENYASSSWCLNELIEILKCKKEGQHVIPVFYKIDPTHVRKQTGSYQTAFAKHEQDPRHNQEKLHKWKAVLHQVANIEGFHSCQYSTEADLVEGIIKDVLKKLDHKFPNELRGLYIVEQNYEYIEGLLRTKPKEVRFIGIWGIGGIGKTTMAAALFDKFSSEYEGCCFLKNVREESESCGIDYLCCKLLSVLLGVDFKSGTDINVRSSFNMSRLKCKKVFIVLDDVNSPNQLKKLVGGHDWVGAGSRVIVTTRNKHVLLSGGVDEIYEVKPMNSQDSLLLFSLNAFNKIHLEKGFEELSKKVVVHAKGIPLALEVLGSFLCLKSEDEWGSALAKLKKIPDAEILKVLRLSYDELDDTEKNIFLDIACYFKGHHRDDVASILNACGFFAVIGIKSLLEKALITITSSNRIEMHDLIQEMGREVVRQESTKNPGLRSRLWESKEICDVLKNNRGTDAVEGIFLDLNDIADLSISSRSFKKMSNLRLLSLYYSKSDTKRSCNCVHLRKGLASLPNSLRYFRWDRCPLKCLPSAFCPEKLVQLSMLYSNVEKLWNGVQNLPSLEYLNLSFSSHLMELPDLSRAPNLKYLYFAKCIRLQYVHPSISSLPKLECLSLWRCKALKSLWGKSVQASLPPAPDCSTFQQLSLMSDCITKLILGSTALHELPSSILHLRNLQIFAFAICESLMELPENFAHQITLSTPTIENYRDSLITLPYILQSPGFRYVKTLRIVECFSLSELPGSISQLSSLEKLTLISCHITSLPESIKYLPRLMVLDLFKCQKLLSIPELPPCLQVLYVSGCISVRTVLSSTCEPPKRNGGKFLFQNCINLDQESLDIILKDALVRIYHAALAKSNEDEEDAHMDDSLPQENIFFCLPVGSIKIQNWSNYHSIEANLITIQIPPSSNFSGIVFVVLHSQAQAQSCIPKNENMGCNCYLETRGDQWLCITSFFDNNCYSDLHYLGLDSDHVCVWYDEKCCEKIMKEIKNNAGGTVDNLSLTFEFFGPSINPYLEDKQLMIKECGIRLIYPSQDQVMEEEGQRRSKRTIGIYELHEAEHSGPQNGLEGCDGNVGEQEVVPPSKKLKE